MENLTENYQTISAESRGLYKEKGSRFIAYAFPVTSESDVKDKLSMLRNIYHDARHHCYAYRLGWQKLVYRQHDDGEPAGTAGKPIFGQILSFDLTNILVVVIRYFGGIKLGVGGLITAYRTAARDALEQAKVVSTEVKNVNEVLFGYERMNDIMNMLKENEADFRVKEFKDTCRIVYASSLLRSTKISEKFEKIQNVTVNHLGTE